MYKSFLFFFFFFQAEDGIRDYKVTGVQTCALPISSGRYVAAFSAAACLSMASTTFETTWATRSGSRPPVAATIAALTTRSAYASSADVIGSPPGLREPDHSAGVPSG